MTDVIEKGKRGRVEDDKVVYSDDVLAEARELGIEEFAIREGGDYRMLQKKKVYWLPLPELIEFERADMDIKDDQDFWEFFKTMIDSRQLQTKEERTGQKQTRSWRDNWSHAWDDWKPKKISQWWSDYGGYSSESFKGGGKGDALTKQLALALRAINTTVSVVNDTTSRFTVSLAHDGPEQPSSYTSFDEKQIVVSPQALLDTSIKADEGIEITTGWALHEGSHVKYTSSLLDALTKPTTLTPLNISSLLHNIIEDVRIEGLTAEKFPGFAEYFTTHNAYLWNLMKDKVPTTWGPELTDKMNSVIAMVKWGTEYEPTAMADPALAQEFPWWRDWLTRYIEGREPIRQSLIRALDHLKEDPKTKQQLEKLGQEEGKLGGSRKAISDADFKKMLKDLKQAFQNGIDPCPSPGHDHGQSDGGQEVELSAEQAQQLDQLLREEYQTHEAFYKMKDGQRDVQPTIESTRPVESSWSKQAYRRPGSMVERMRSVFFFRKKRVTEHERLLKNGLVDEEELWRVGVGDTRVFERTTQPEEMTASVTLLVDVSGSMVGGGLEKAQMLANVMMACLRTQRGVRTRVRAHSTGMDSGSGQSCKIYRVWEPGDPDTRIGLLSTVGHGSNFDGFAIDWCAKELDATAEADEAKLLIVLSDGLPAGTIKAGLGSLHYGGANAMEHMMTVSREWGRRGVYIVQIAIDDAGLRPQDQARMFQHWVGYETDQKLLTDLTRVLAKTFGAQEV